MITYAVIGIVVLMAVAIFMAYNRFLDLKRIYQQKTIFIEVTPHRQTAKTPEATEQLFHIFYNAGANQSLRYKLLHRNNTFSLSLIHI